MRVHEARLDIVVMEQTKCRRQIFLGSGDHASESIEAGRVEVDHTAIEKGFRPRGQIFDEQISQARSAELLRSARTLLHAVHPFRFSSQ